MARTEVEFAPTVDPWPVVDAWAKKHSFSVDAYGDWGRRYKRGDGFVTPVCCTQVEVTEAGFKVSVWAPSPLGGAELEVQDINGLAVFVRRKARKLANSLLQQLGGPEIAATTARQA